ncbi:uncharacterized protein LOC110977793 [Acanthaster planci]|uniref:Uncharacterized protein LOC110977793 n=1 Tax=Acanthaster planci TaxID=133434 RepID=A0A8B7Y408_ACAPL|nr:uncharacterized protein LOC110977793 [Acanthaster planci]
MEEKQSVNAFANDGSFMEMFKKRMEEEKLRCGSAGSGRAGVGSQSCQQLSMSATDDKDPGETLKSSDELARSSGTEDPAGRVTDCTEHANVKDVHLHRHSAMSAQIEGVELAMLTCTNMTKDIKDCHEEQALSLRDEHSTKSEGSKSIASSTPAQKKYSLLSHVGKRRDGKVALKTGAVKKQRKTEPQENKEQDSWSKYMAEVQKYKAHVCGDEDKSRPLVK